MRGRHLFHLDLPHIMVIDPVVDVLTSLDRHELGVVTEPKERSINLCVDELMCVYE